VLGSGFTLTNDGSISGGAGASGSYGGDFAFGPGGNGGAGGDGGAGVSGSGFTLTNDGSISGGAGASGGGGGAGSGNPGGCDSSGFCDVAGPDGVAGSDGAGGAGVLGTGSSSVVTSGSISGGLDAGGSTRADAVDFSGGGNTLTLQNGYVFTGNVVSTSGTTDGGDTLALGGDSTTDGGTGDGSFDVTQIVADMPTSWTGTDQFYGFAAYKKTGTSTWTLTGGTAALTPWAIDDGTLAITSDASLGDAAGTVTLNGGTLRTTLRAVGNFNSITSARTFYLGGTGGTLWTDEGTILRLDGTITDAAANTSGRLVKDGKGTLLLTATNDYSGGTLIADGAVDVSADGALGTGLVMLTGNGNPANQIALNFSGADAGDLDIANLGNGAVRFDSASAGSADIDVSGSRAKLWFYNGADAGSATIYNEGASSTISFNAGTSAADAVINNLGSGPHSTSITFEDADAGHATITNSNGTITFGGHSSARNAVLTNTGSGIVYFNGQSDAGSATIRNRGAGSAVSFAAGTSAADATIENAGNGFSGAVLSFENADAGAATITNGKGGTVHFFDTATAANATITNRDGGIIRFHDHSTAGDAILVNDTGSRIFFEWSPDASGATIRNDAGGQVFVTYLDAGYTDFAIGSLSGDGNVTLEGAYDPQYGSVPLRLHLGGLGKDDTFGGLISDDDGSGGHYGDEVVKTGSGTLTLDGANTYTGVTEVQQGALIVGSVAGNGASVAGDVVVSGGATLGGHGRIGGDVEVAGGGIVAPGHSIGTLTVDGNFTASQGSVLEYEFGAPDADFQALGSGDSVTVGGNLELDGATLDVTDAGGFGAGLYNLFSWGGTLTEAHGGLMLGATPAGSTLAIQTLTTDKQINLLNTGGVALGFWNADFQADATRMGGGSGTWSSTAPVWTDATGSVTSVMVPQPGFAIFGGAAGTVTVDEGAGAVSVTGMQFVTNGYTLDGDTLTLVADGSGSAPAIRVGDGSAAGAGVSAILDAVLAGSDGLVKADLGTLVLNGSNTYAGGTTIKGGTLSVSGDDNLGAASGGLTLDGGTLQVTGTTFEGTSRTLALGNGGGGFDIVDAANTFTVDQALSGAGALTKSGAGTLVLDGANSYRGGTTIRGGTLRGDTSSLQGAIVNDASLVFDQAFDGSFTGTLSGAGTLGKTGAGTLVINGDHSFNGATRVQSGILVVGDDGHPGATLGGGTVTVGDGATLGGIGTIGGLDLAGTLSPGNSVGTLHVGGDVVLEPGSTYRIDVQADGRSDTLAVDGSVSILGGNVLVLGIDGNWAPSTGYTLISAGNGVSGSFAGVDNNLAFLAPQLGYDSHAVYLTLQRNDIDFAAVARTDNQRATARAAESLGSGAQLYDALVTMDATRARAAFDQLSGEAYASTRTALLEDDHQVREAIDRHLLGLDNAADGTHGKGGRASAWTAAWGHWGDHESDGNAAELAANGSGLLVGADVAAGESGRIGAVLGHRQASIDMAARAATTHATADMLGLYAGVRMGAFALRGGLTRTWQDAEVTRQVAFAGYGDVLHGHFKARTWQGFVEAGLPFEVGHGQRLEPFVNMARVEMRTDAFDERGGAAALHVAAGDDALGTATLGLRHTLALDAGVMQAHASLGWRRAWGDLTPAADMSLDGGTEFTIFGVPVARNALAVQAGMNMRLGRHTQLDASYSGQFAGDARDQGARLSLRVDF
jgi:outer membrane autotransporter protein